MINKMEMSESIDADKLKHGCENHENCMKMIQAVLDGSATPEEMHHFKENMSVCLPCIEGYELETAIKDALKQKVEKKCCPQDLVSQIKSKIGIAVLFASMLLLEIKLFGVIF